MMKYAVYLVLAITGAQAFNAFGGNGEVRTQPFYPANGNDDQMNILPYPGGSNGNDQVQSLPYPSGGEHMTIRPFPTNNNGNTVNIQPLVPRGGNNNNNDGGFQLLPAGGQGSVRPTRASDLEAHILPYPFPEGSVGNEQAKTLTFPAGDDQMKIQPFPTGNGDFHILPYVPQSGNNNINNSGGGFRTLPAGNGEFGSNQGQGSVRAARFVEGEAHILPYPFPGGSNGNDKSKTLPFPSGDDQMKIQPFPTKNGDFNILPYVPQGGNSNNNGGGEFRTLPTGNGGFGGNGFQSANSGQASSEEAFNGGVVRATRATNLDVEGVRPMEGNGERF